MPLLSCVENWANLLYRCKVGGCMLQSSRLYAFMLCSGLQLHPSVGGNHLLSILVEVGCMDAANLHFRCMPQPDKASWDLFITGYANHGSAGQIVALYKTLPKNLSTQICGSAFVAILKACTELKDLETASKVHSEIVTVGLHARDVFVGSTLVDMYAKCGLLEKAKEAFDNLLVRNVVLWNALITGYLENAVTEDVIGFYEEMQREGVLSDDVTLIFTLKACASLEAATKGQEIHAEVTRRGLESDLRVSSTLINMYSKCGHLLEAQKVFDTILFRDVILWTALIAGQADSGRYQEALTAYYCMQSDGISPNAVTYACILKACSSIEALDKGQKFHGDITMKGLLERDLLVGNALLGMYTKCNLLAEAQAVFSQLSVLDQVSWNMMIAGYAEHGCGEEALSYFHHMKDVGTSPDAATFASSLKACVDLGFTEKGREIHAEIVTQGIDGDLIVGSTLIGFYATSGLLAEAQEVLENIPSRDMVSWTALIAGYAQHGQSEEALCSLECMRREGFPPMAATLVCCLKASGYLGAVDKGHEIHTEVAMKGMEQEVIVGSTLVDMYVKCGSVVEAEAVFEKLTARNMFSWSALVAGYAMRGECNHALRIVGCMQQEGIQPNAITISSLLTACSHAGLVDVGHVQFEAINMAYGLIPALEHYTGMLDVLCRADQIRKAILLVNTIPFHPCVVAWRTVLGASKL